MMFDSDDGVLMRLGTNNVVLMPRAGYKRGVRGKCDDSGRK